MRIDHDLHIDAAIDTVWAITLDIEHWPEATPTITTVERVDDGPLAVGSQARIKQPAQPTRTWTVRRLEAPHHYEWDTTAMGVTMRGGHHLTTEGGGCRNHLTLDLSGRGSGLFGRLFRRTLLDALTKENEGFKRIAEGRTSST